MPAINDDTTFAVVDVETTGFSPRNDRVIEIAIVRVRSSGERLDEYATLVNPGSAVGPTYVHGISASDIAPAPAFSDLLGDIVARLRGTIVVGHNVRFDLGFLREECVRAGYEAPSMPSLCTLRLSQRLGIALPTRKLRVSCDYAGIELDEAHSALGDAVATSKLLLHYLAHARGQGLVGLSALGCENAGAVTAVWPSRPESGRVLRRVPTAAAHDEGAFLRRVLQRLEIEPDTEAGVAEYYDVLDRALEDRHVSEGEAEALYEVARLWSLKPEDVRVAHRRYLCGVVDAALGDGLISPSEQEDLTKVARLLGLGEETLAAVRAEAQAACAAAAREAAVASPSSAHDLIGKSICFTGALSGRIAGSRITRTMAETLASTAGLLVRDSVNKDLDILVLADPNTQSTKAKRAREYGARLMGERELWQTLGVMVA